ncbi:MAG: TSUP family transporter [Lachnospiraceae bacterium]|nr:TSUP family transporter [Lachnospiraceae bacterium]
MNLSVLTPKVFLIICPLVFLAGFLDAIAGGGALISIPAYLIAGIPVHTAIATNKLSASFGATTSATCFLKNKMINLKLGIPSVAFAMLGSTIGANLSVMMDEAIMIKALYIILPLTAFVVLNKNIFHDHPDSALVLDKKTFAIVMTVAFFIGIYDGIFGPGAGTFTIICFTVFGKMNIKNANAQTKLINLTTTVTALFVFLMKGQVMILLGISAGICNMLGSWMGAKLVMTKGSRITKPALLMVLALLTIKIAGVY